MAMQPEHETQLVAASIDGDPVVGPLVREMTKDVALQAGWKSLDVPAFVQHFGKATDHITAYAGFHQRQERLWAVKIGTGKIAPELEEGLKRSVPAARDHLNQGFAALEECMQVVEGSEFKHIANTHVAALSKRCTFDEGNVFGRTASGYFQRLGFSAAHVAEFKRQYAPIGHDFIGKLGKGDISNIRSYSATGVNAQIEILNYTEQHGLDYIRGAGPPAWAVTASAILAYFGISIAAWVIVVIAAAILITLAILCAVYWNSLPAWAKAGCGLLAAAGLISFVF